MQLSFHRKPNFDGSQGQFVFVLLAGRAVCVVCLFAKNDRSGKLL